MSGYCSIDRLPMEIAPSRTITTDSDMANIGRRIKKFFIFVSAYFVVGKTFIPLRSFCKPVVAAAIMGAAAWASFGLIGRFLPNSYIGTALTTLLSIGIAVVVYFILVLALRMITAEDLKMIPKGEKLARLLRIR